MAVTDSLIGSTNGGYASLNTDPRESINKAATEVEEGRPALSSSSHSSHSWRTLKSCDHEQGCQCYTLRGQRMCDQGKKEIRAKRVGVKSFKMSPGVAQYYKRQNEMIDFITGMHSTGAEGDEGSDDESDDGASDSRAAALAIQISFSINVILLGANAANMVCSGSMAVLASLLDAVLDLASGGILFVVDTLKSAKDKTGQFPVGKSRLEPIGVIVFSMLMGFSALQVLFSSSERLFRGFTGHVEFVTFDMTVRILTCSIIFTKVLLYLYCKQVAAVTGSSSVQAYAQDHMNDALMNSIGICGLCVSGLIRSAWWFDPLGGIVISCYIIWVWGRMAAGTADHIVGKTADAAFLQQITYMVVSHDDRIQFVDTVRAYHFGKMFIVEVDVVLPPEMPLREAHDIGESLQFKIEKRKDVERSFVHLDYEWQHKPEH